MIGMQPGVPRSCRKGRTDARWRRGPCGWQRRRTRRERETAALLRRSDAAHSQPCQANQAPRGNLEAGGRNSKGQAGRLSRPGSWHRGSDLPIRSHSHNRQSTRKPVISMGSSHHHQHIRPRLHSHSFRHWRDTGSPPALGQDLRGNHFPGSATTAVSTDTKLPTAPRKSKG